jgi:plasmid stabilization system protein ParE
VKIVWAPVAIDRASEEASFIAQDKPEAAKRWLSGLFKAVGRLESFPRSGKRLPELPSSQYRQLVYKSHRVVYRVSGDVVVILTVRRFKQRLNLLEL